MSVETLKVLEGRVDSVLSRHAALREERRRLQEELGAARAQIDAMAGQLAKIERERGEVKARVESILSRLESLDLS